MTETWNAQMENLGAFIRRQRKLANLSLRQLAERTTLSNPYLSQIERGLHQPSVRVLKLISGALNVSAETAAHPGGFARRGPHPATRPRKTARPGRRWNRPSSPTTRLADEQKAALLAVYHSMLRG